MSYDQYNYDPYVRAYNRIADGGEVCSGGFDPRNNPDDRKRLILAVLAVLVFIIMFVIFSGCTRKVYVPVERTTTVYETLRDTVVEYELKEMHDTVTINTAGRDTLSYLHNSYSYSFASIKDGKFGHSLGVKPNTKLLLPLQMKFIHIIDSIPYPVPVEVEKKLTWWQKVKIEYGGFAMGVATAFAFILGLFIFTDKNKMD